MLGHNIQLPGLLIANNLLHGAIQGLPVSCNGATYCGSMRGKYCSDSWQMLFQIQQAGPCLPFMEMCYQFLAFQFIKPGEVLNCLTCRITKQCRFDIIPLAADGIQPIAFPQAFKNFVFLVKTGSKVKHNCNRPAGNFPMPDSNPYPFMEGVVLPIRK